MEYYALMSQEETGLLGEDIFSEEAIYYNGQDMDEPLYLFLAPIGQQL